MTDKVLFIFEMIGVIACAASGTASGINKHMGKSKISTERK